MHRGRPPSSALEREISLQAPLIAHVLGTRASDAAALVERLGDPAARRWIVTGCGDSLFAGMAAQYWWADSAGLPLEAHDALAYSRYLYKASGPETVVFAVSYSGSTVRVIEAARAARSRGATVVAITANPASELVEIADEWLCNDARTEESNCRTLSFQAASLLLRLVAGAVGERLGASGLDALAELPAAVDALVLESAAPVAAAARALPDAGDFVVIGGGYGHAAASYGAAKLYEAATIPAHAAELEQFIHCEIFSVGPGSAVVLLAPSGRSHARAVELADGLATLGVETLGVSDDPAFADRCRHFAALPRGWGEDALPFLAAIPLQWFALRWAQRRGENPDRVANKAVNRPLIESPLQWEDADYEATRA